jgi:DNA-binding beta-propeller fold protein YncE
MMPQTRERSWMAPDAKRSDLLYIAEETGDVAVFSYPKGTPEGTLTGLPDPQGECVDKHGDVFVTTFGGQEILEYAHGGTNPINTLQNPGELMEGCSVDRKSDTLAVINFAPMGGSGGGVSLYANATGSPTVLTDPNLMLGYQLGYDNKGNLFLDGVNASSQFEFAELPKGSSTFTEISLNATIATPGGVQWDGTYVVVGDATGGKVYQTNGAGGKVERTMTLSDSDGIFQFFIDRKKFIGPNVDSTTAMFWRYPAGGSPTKTLSGLTDPFGAVVSRGKK